MPRRECPEGQSWRRWLRWRRFGEQDQALMIALYIAMDSFGTACNVTGDGAVAIVIDKMFKKQA